MDTDQSPVAEALPDIDWGHLPGREASVGDDLLERARAAAVGYPELEDVLRRLDAMDELDVEDLPAEFDAIHRLLRAALGDVPS